LSCRYVALTDARQFHEVTLLSAAIRSGMVNATPVAQISSETGGAFTIFGGHIVGRQIELVPNVRIVQAWRPVDCEPGIYSIARFGLAREGLGTRSDDGTLHERSAPRPRWPTRICCARLMILPCVVCLEPLLPSATGCGRSWRYYERTSGEYFSDFFLMFSLAPFLKSWSLRKTRGGSN
jgi:hypothetical protein